MNDLFEISSKIATPLALGGFFAAILFSILRQIIQNGFFVSLTSSATAVVIKSVIDKLFILALVAMILGFLGFALSIIKNTQDTTSKTPSNHVDGNYNIVVQGDKNNIGTNPKTEEKIDSLNTKTDVLLNQSERQPQIAMVEFVRFNKKKKTWKAPSKIFPGSIVELHGFTCDLQLSTDAGFRASVFGEGWDRSKEIVIEGRSGMSSKWQISTDSSCEGKVIVFSSPRIRSLSRSWNEESTVR